MGSTVDGSVNSMTVGVVVVGFLVPSLLVVRPTFWVLELDSSLALAGYVDRSTIKSTNSQIQSSLHWYTC